MDSQEIAWWQHGIVYQIYPRSFQDSNGDGIGDLAGIIQRLDYVRDLGVNAVWLSPIYPSPMADFGYDVADYTGIHSLFGDMADFDRLLAETHRRGLKLILDLVPNHSSNQHPWFLESRRSRDNPRRDWYFWRDPAPDGGPPNNWLSVFGGPAWTFDETTGQYYLHQFAREQPELNYRNPEVLAAMQAVMRFWLDKGIDGFRVDVIEFILKDEQLRDEPENPDWDGVDPHGRLKHIHTRDLPGVHDLIREFRGVVDAYPERVMIGEVFQFDETIVSYYGAGGDGCHLPFNFRLIYRDWSAPSVREAVASYEAALGSEHWPNWVLGNHDQHRIATRVGFEQARVAMLLLLTLRGTPTVYYGDEIGMEDVSIPPERIQDPAALNQPAVAHIFGRDPERTPMQWDDSPNAGFCPPAMTPWLPLAEDFRQRNVARQDADPDSMLNLFRRVTALRQGEPALYRGTYREISLGEADAGVLGYLREAPGARRFLVLLNFAAHPWQLDLAALGAGAEVRVASHGGREGPVALNNLALGADEGLVLALD